MPGEALVRLTQGRAAEVQYKAARNTVVKPPGGADSNPSRTGQDSKNGNDDSSINGAAASEDDGGGKASLRFESQQFDLLRRESDRFNDGDISRRHPQERAPQQAASPSLLPPEPPPPPPPASTPSRTLRARVQNPADYSPQEGERDSEHEAGSPPPPPLPSSTAAELPGWDGPLPEEAAGFLIADGFLIPGKADGGVYLVVPTAAEEKGFPEAEGGEGGSRVEGDRAGAAAAAGTAAAAERIVRLTSPKR